MQPETPRVPSGPELAPVDVAPNGDRIPVLPTPESGILPGGERHEQVAEAGAIAADAAAPGMAVPPPLPGVVANTTTALPSDDSGPAVAADEDVIEKEWVDKAKKILEETKDDPYKRTERVNALQKDYLMKRYNKDLGAEAA